MNSVIVVILCMISLAAAQPFANSYVYSHPNCGGEVKKIIVWESKCTNESTTGSRYYTCNGNQLVSYTPCDAVGCPPGLCNIMPIPQTCLPDNSKRDCADTIMPSPTGWYTMHFYTGLSCTGTVHTVQMSSANDCQVNLAFNTSVYYTCASTQITENNCLGTACGKDGGICTPTPITMTCSDVGGINEGSTAYSCGAGPLPTNMSQPIVTTGSTLPPSSQPSASQSSTQPSTQSSSQTQSQTISSNPNTVPSSTQQTQSQSSNPSGTQTQTQSQPTITTGVIEQPDESSFGVVSDFCLAVLFACALVAFSM